jgi:hypothetical protein
MSRSRVGEVAALLVFWAAATAYYTFVVSAGYLKQWPSWTALYDAQAQGFLAGHLYLPEEPSAALKALANPFDPANQKYWRWDHSYYAERFYLYWGLVPAALLAAAKALFRIHRPVGDEVLVFAFTVGRLLAGTLFIRALARQSTWRPPPWAVWVGLLVFAFANPTPFLLARGAIYEASIAAGICFCVTGMYLALRSVSGPIGSSSGWGAAAGAAFALAGGSRISLLPAAGAMTLLTAGAAWIRGRREATNSRPWLRATWTAIPAALIVAVHLFINHLRFGGWFEFGVSYQLGIPFHLALRFIIPNLYLYAFQPSRFSCSFPFVSAPWDQARSVSPRWLKWPADYRWIEPNSGLLVALPFAWLLVLAVAIAWWRRTGVRRAAVERPASSPIIRWTVLSLASWAFLAAAPVMVMFSLSMRYEADFATAGLLLAMLGGWYLLTTVQGSNEHFAFSATYAALGFLTVVFGALLGLTGYSDHVARFNQSLWTRLVNALDLCSVL